MAVIAGLYGRSGGGLYGGVTAPGAATFEDDVRRDVENLAFRLQAINANPPPAPKAGGLLDTLLRGLNTLGSTVRAGVIETADDEPGVNLARILERAYSKQDEATGGKLLEALNLQPENKIGQAVAGFAAEVLSDPLTYLGGGLLRGGLKAGIPFGKEVAVSKLLGLSDEAVKGKRFIGDLGLFQRSGTQAKAAGQAARAASVGRAAAEVIPGVTPGSVAPDLARSYDDAAEQLRRTLEGEGEAALQARLQQESPILRALREEQGADVARQVEPGGPTRTFAPEQFTPGSGKVGNQLERQAQQRLAQESPILSAGRAESAARNAAQIANLGRINAVVSALKPLFQNMPDVINVLDGKSTSTAIGGVPDFLRSMLDELEQVSGGMFSLDGGTLRFNPPIAPFDYGALTPKGARAFPGSPITPAAMGAVPDDVLRVIRGEQRMVDLSKLDPMSREMIHRYVQESGGKFGVVGDTLVDNALNIGPKTPLDSFGVPIRSQDEIAAEVERFRKMQEEVAGQTLKTPDTGAPSPIFHKQVLELVASDPTIAAVVSLAKRSVSLTPEQVRKYGDVLEQLAKMSRGLFEYKPFTKVDAWGRKVLDEVEFFHTSKVPGAEDLARAAQRATPSPSAGAVVANVAADAVQQGDVVDRFIDSVVGFARKTPVLRGAVQLGEDVGKMFGAASTPVQRFLRESRRLLRNTVGLREQEFNRRIFDALKDVKEDEFLRVFDLLEDPAERALHGLKHTRPELPMRHTTPQQVADLEMELSEKLGVARPYVYQIASGQIELTDRKIGRTLRDKLESYRRGTDNLRRLGELQIKYDQVIAGGLAGSRQMPEHIERAVKGLEGVFGEIANEEQKRALLRSLLDAYAPHIKNVDPNRLPPTHPLRNLTTKDPNTEHREFIGTLRQLNDEWTKVGGAPFFVPNPSTAAMVRAMRAIRTTETFDFFKRVLSNEEFALTSRQAKELAEAVGLSIDDWAESRGLVKWNPPDKFRQGLAQEFGGTTKLPFGVEGVAQDFAFYVDPEFAKQFNQVVKAYSDESVESFMKWFDKGTNAWKRLVTLYNPAFYLNNMVGNIWNMYLGGFRNPVHFLNANKVMTGGDFSQRVAGQMLTTSELMRLAQQHGALSGAHFRNLSPERGLIGRAESMQKALQPKGALQKTGAAIERSGRFLEDHSRMAMFLDGLARSTAKTVDEAAAEAAERMERYLFDYTPEGFSQFENVVMRRIFPFWSWTRNNVPLQLREITRQPAKFLGIKRVREAAETAFPLSDEEQQTRPEYLKEAIPFFGLRGEDLTKIPGIGPLLGNIGRDPIMWNPRLPAQDINRLFPLTDSSAPGREILSSLNPVFQLPIEMVTNFDLFTRKPIERYQGQTIPVSIPGLGERRLSPKVVHAAEQLGGVALRAPGAIMRALSEERDTADVLRAVRIVLPGLYTFDPDKVRVNQLIEERQRLQDYVRKLKAEGREVPTVTQLRQQGMR